MSRSCARRYVPLTQCATTGHRLDTYSRLVTIPPLLASGRRSAIAELSKSTESITVVLAADMLQARRYCQQVLKAEILPVLKSIQSIEPENTAALE